MLTMAEAMLQIKYPKGRGQSNPDQTEELSVTQKNEHGNAAEREYAEQKKLKYWYENNVGYHVWKKKCETCGKVFYTICNYRRYCHLSDCRSIAEQKRNEERKQKHYSEHICSVCSTPFVSKRYDARFCSNACRQKAYRNNSKED